MVSTARAQDAPSANISPPAEKFAISPGGVDMRSGRYVYNQTDLRIGGEGGGLSLARTLAQPVAGHNNPFANFSHDWDILLSEKRIDIVGGHFNHSAGYPDYQIEIAFGGLSQTFRATGGASFEQVSRSGWARLSNAGDRNSAGVVYTLQTGDGTTATFRPMGSADCSSLLRCAYVAQIVYADGTTLNFGYDNQGSNATRLRSVTSNRGYALLFEYSGGLVSKTCALNLAQAPIPAGSVCPAGAQAATYSYTSVPFTAPRLAGATDPAGAIWGFTYAPSLMGFVRPGETAPWLVNTIRERTDDDGLVQEIVDQQSFADGSSYTYGWDETPFVPLHASSIAGGTFTDNLGRVTRLRYDFPTQPFDPGQGHGTVSGDDQPSGLIVQQVTPGPVEVTDPLGRVTTTDYCDPSLMANLPANWLHRCLVMPVPASTRDPEGIRTDMVWNLSTRHLLQTRQIARPGSLQPNGQAWPDIVQAATYDCSLAHFRFCNKPVTRTDANLNSADYGYDPAHGGVPTETGPAPSQGAPRPQTRHIYAQRYAWISNGGGGYAQAATPVWLRTQSSLCRTSAATGNPAAPCATAGDEVRTDYDYGPDSGPNTLLLRGQTVTSTDGGVATILRTCFSYDSQGRKISETQPNANLASCP